MAVARTTGPGQSLRHSYASAASSVRPAFGSDARPGCWRHGISLRRGPRRAIRPASFAHESEVGVFWKKTDWTHEEYLYIRGRVPGFSQVALFRQRDVIVREGDGPTRLVRGVSASAELFDVLASVPFSDAGSGRARMSRAPNRRDTELWFVAGDGRQSVDHRRTRDARWNAADHHWCDAARLLVSRSRSAHLDARAADTGITKLEFDTCRPRRTKSRRPCDGSARLRNWRGRSATGSIIPSSGTKHRTLTLRRCVTLWSAQYGRHFSPRSGRWL
jgi:hypothetical protein